MKPKKNQKGDTKQAATYDACQTPSYALQPLLPYLQKFNTIWEPADGEGILVKALLEGGVGCVVCSDILVGQNFFTYDPSDWDAIVTNPPYSIKRKWLKRCYELGKPFALLVPLETIGSSEVQDMLGHYGFEMMLLDARIDFKMPNLGWGGNGAQFPVVWLTWRILPAQVMFGSIKEAKKQWKEDMKDAILADKARKTMKETLTYVQMLKELNVKQDDLS